MRTTVLALLLALCLGLNQHGSLAEEDLRLEEEQLLRDLEEAEEVPVEDRNLFQRIRDLLQNLMNRPAAGSPSPQPSFGFRPFGFRPWGGGCQMTPEQMCTKQCSMYCNRWMRCNWNWNQQVDNCTCRCGPLAGTVWDCDSMTQLT